MSQRTLIPVVVCVCMLLPGCRTESNADNDLFCPESEETLLSGPNYYSDTVEVAGRHGIDYRALIPRCLAREPQAMHLLFWLCSEAGGLDAASAEGHACFVGLVLQRVGDAFFAECLAREPAEVQDMVREFLLNEAGYDDGREKEVLGKLRRLYPRCFPETFKPE